MSGRDWATSEYSRIYHTVIKDPKLGPIFRDDRAWAAYTRLLITADGTYPAPAPLPRSLARYAEKKLSEAGVLILVGDDHYTLSGLSDEREGRAHEQRNGGTVRAETAERGTNGRFLPAGPSGGPSGGDQPVAPAIQLSRAEQSKEETSRATAGAADDPYDETVRWLAGRGAWVEGPKLQTDLARLVDKRDARTVIAAMAAVPNAETAAQFIYGARNALFPLPGSQTAKPPSRAEQEQADAQRTIAAARAAREAAQA